MTTYAHLIPANDSQRLAALQAYRLLGTGANPVFDEMVRLVAQLFQVPIALISLVAADTVEFTGNFGLPGIHQVERPDSVCSVAVLSDDTTVFENLHTNPCQLTNEAAARQLNLGFYAGHPLHTATGYNIGALCIIDHQPRRVSEPERARLAALAGVVMQLFDLRLAALEQPALAAALWDAIYQRISTSLTRLETLRSLSQWEESPTTGAARQYQLSMEEEVQLILQALSAEIRAALQQVSST